MAAWVAHANQRWTQDHLEEAPEVVLPLLQGELQAALGSELRWHHAAVHRWRYAQFEGTAQPRKCLWDQDLGLGVSGDAWGGGGVWGQMGMPPHPSMKDDDIRAMIDWVLDHK
mgnify:CR=1 FL=1